MATQSVLDTAREALLRVQQFEADKLSREDDLGKQLNFADAVPLARALVDIYQRLPLASLDDFSDGQLNVVTKQAQADYNAFKQVLDFKATSPNAAEAPRRAAAMRRVRLRLGSRVVIAVVLVPSQSVIKP